MDTNRKSKNSIAAVLLFAIALFSLVCVTPATHTAYADMGPKPSVVVTVKNLDGKICYGTLLSYCEQYGPHYAYNPKYYDIPYECDPESKYYDAEFHTVWKAFVEYVDPGGYYYQQVHWKCHETGKISWTYYPPSKFKVLLYFPETQTFATSGIYERYAFHSYFSAKLSNNDLTVSQTESINVSKNYDYTWEFVSLLVRIVATVLLEVGVTYLFKLRTKKTIIAVTVVNVVTQTVMNVVLNLLAFFQGGWALLWYIPIELAVFIIEAVAYIFVFNRKQSKTVEVAGDSVINSNRLSIGKCVLLSFVANLVSFVAGFALVLVIPGVF